MTEPHMIRIDSRDLRDLIDDRDRLESSLAECARQAMNSSDEWRDELAKAHHVITEFRVFEREIQEALGYDQPDLIPPGELVADIRRLVEKQLAWATYSEPARPQYMTRGPAAPAHGDLGAGWGMSTDELGHHRMATPPAEPATPPATEAAAVVGHLITDARLHEVTMLPLDKLPGWSHDQDSPPSAPHPRTWKAGDSEPSAAGPAAVWGVTTDLGDLYRPKANEELGWFWSRADGTWLRWETMLAAGPVTETFPPGPTPHTADAELPAEDESTPAPAVPMASDNTTTTDPAW